ncbi:MAG TPA: SRPBCC family protein [Gammaproteobacteria bacterium]
MAKVAMSTRLPMTVGEVWELLGKFNALPDWHPAVQRSELEEGGHVRRLSLLGGGEIVERLEKLDDQQHAYRYRIESSPLPVADYVAEIRVTENRDGGCTVEWSSDFAASGAPEADATRAIREIYKAGFDNLRKLFGG